MTVTFLLINSDQLLGVALDLWAQPAGPQVYDVVVRQSQNFQRGPPDTPSPHPAPHVAVTALLTVFPGLGVMSPWTQQLLFPKELKT